MDKKQKNIPEITIKYSPKILEKVTVFSSNDAYKLFLPFFLHDTMQLIEQFAVMYLNRANKVLGIYVASTGGMTGTVADIRLILGIALKTASTGIMLCHNHPSGNLKPSKTDIYLTGKIKEAGSVMDIKLLDHLIITAGDDYMSFQDEGLI